MSVCGVSLKLHGPATHERRVWLAPRWRRREGRRREENVSVGNVARPARPAGCRVLTPQYIKSFATVSRSRGEEKEQRGRGGGAAEGEERWSGVGDRL